MEGEPGTAFDGEVVIARVRFVAEDTGFGVVEADRDGDEIVLVGLIGHLERGERVGVRGVWQDDRRFGMQVKVEQAEPRGPTGTKGLILYLERVKGIGPTRAARLYQAFGDDVLDAVDRDPRAAFKSVGLSGRQASEAARSWDGLRSTRALHLLLAPHGLAWLVARLDKQYGPNAHRVVREHPYELTSVFGVGFQIADTIARAVGVRPDDPERAQAALVHVLVEAERDGSTCLPVDEAERRTAALVGAPADGFGDHVLVEDGFVYRPSTLALERELAERVRDLLGAEPALETPSLDAGELEPAPEQRAAVEHAFAHRLSIVTGGPGTGKTATIKLICAAAHEQRTSVLLVAPTGRAARRVSESTGLDASTVHSALGWIPGEGPQRTEEDPLRADMLVVDETSMANLELLVTLLRAAGDGMHVVLVGDADQLAPVGAGKPFAELVAGKTVPTVALTHIFRQAAGSMIVRGAHAVRQGQPPSFAAEEELERDLFLIERDDPQAALDEIVALVGERLPGYYGVDPVTDIQVFAPVYRGPLGIDALNARLREALNPAGAPVLGGRLREGDKLMLSGRNLHDLGLMNGTVLRLVGVREELVTVEADGVVVDLPDEDAPALQLAYACSVHKGQGIELPVAVLVAHPAAGAFFLRREMLYTAMTRARKATVIVGKREVVAAAARRADTSGRYSRLTDRLRA
jgi:exodeoxyribonuclease V alpha subunit